MDGSVPVPSRSGALLEVGPLSGRSGIRATGEISVSTRASWDQALQGLARKHTDVSFVDLSGVSFIDVGGAAALAVTAQHLGTGRIVVDRPPPELPRMTRSGA
ncbi:STAS domain-containing protein [Actinacidiphila oryziradicis]|uniref:STAS domain-containing protein n=1 Tax=Actinacidiphila oryziradicis TaxID=2571141 RepID=A0A4U0S4G6_9ACTN|nr:STAS domain-containing protein [Actinacidiphila oryziradicis]TKA01951.1 STAS domain-containing protein [Actinacidiphila oryziradicis]